MECVEVAVGLQDSSRTRRNRAGGYGNADDTPVDNAVLGEYGVADDVDAAAETIAGEVDDAMYA